MVMESIRVRVRAHVCAPMYVSVSPAHGGVRLSVLRYVYVSALNICLTALQGSAPRSNICRKFRFWANWRQNLQNLFNEIKDGAP
jgi:hypothetical protein